MGAISLYTSVAASSTGCLLDTLISRSEQLASLGLARIPRRGARIARNSVRDGLVDSSVDEMLKICNPAGSMTMCGTSFREPTREISGELSLFPGQSEFAFWSDINRKDRVIPEKPTLMDAMRQGRMIENLLLYRQTFVIRSYEVGADRTASIETLMNLFQETALNHVWLSGISGDGFGTTNAMVLNGLIWVVSRMHVEVDRYPAWGEVVEMDSWVASSGKMGMRRDWLLRNVKTGRVLARATSTWVMMHQKTRRLSKMPIDVRAEISPYFLERHSIQNEVSLKINKLQDESALYKISNLKARRTDLDMNQHVNNVKYVGWMMESVPHDCLENLEIKRITLEYRRECGQTDVVESLTNPEEQLKLPSFRSTCCQPGTHWTPDCTSVEEVDLKTPYEFKSGVTFFNAEKERCLSCKQEQPSRFIHLLKMQGDGAEIVRGRTVWASKLQKSHPAPS